MPALNGNILITDDDPDLRRILRRTLDALGFGVAESPNGEQALQAVEDYKFDALLLDINMPGLGGIATCRQIRKKAPHLQILMLTVRDQEADKLDAFEAGADDYITKPFSVPELTARLKSAVRRSTTTGLGLAAPILIGDIELDPRRRGAQGIRFIALPDGSPGDTSGSRQTAASRLGRRVCRPSRVFENVRASTEEKAGRRSVVSPVSAY